MVFNKFTHLARPSLTKTLTHGYAQSLVAATQSSAPFPRKNQSNKSGRPSTSHQYTAFSTFSATNPSSSKNAYVAAEQTSDHDGSIKLYSDAWQKFNHYGGETSQRKHLQPPRLVGKGSSRIQVEEQEKGDDETASKTEITKEGRTLDRAQSTSAVDDIKKADEDAERLAIATVDDAIATVIQQIQRSSDSLESVRTLEASDPDQVSSTPPRSITTASEEAFSLSTPPSDITAPTSAASEADERAHLEHLQKLHDAKAYSEIPPAFESLLALGIKPTIQAYNALLSSAIQISIGRHSLVPKALDIYSDLLRRKIAPNTTFYSTLMNILASRALDVARTTKALQERRGRHRGLSGNAEFLLASDAADYAIMREDDSMSNAISLFNNISSKQKDTPLSSQAYQLLILACVEYNEMTTLARAYSHLKSNKVTPSASIFPALISIFAAHGDLQSATERYNDYRSLAISDDAGEFSIIGRQDSEVYAALVRGYARCGKREASQRFFDKVIESFSTDSEERKAQKEHAKNIMSLRGQLEHFLETGDHARAWLMIDENTLSDNVIQKALSKICISTADSSNLDLATQAYERLAARSSVPELVDFAMLALSCRRHDLAACDKHWKNISGSSAPSRSWLQPSLSYAMTLVACGQVEQAAILLRKTFESVRANTQSSIADVSDQIDEILQIFAQSLKRSEVTSSLAVMDTLHAMVENGGLIFTVAEQLLASLGPDQISNLSWHHTVLILQVQAGLIGDFKPDFDLTHASRLDHLIELVTSSGSPFDQQTRELIDRAVEKLSESRPDVVEKWEGYKQGSVSSSAAAIPNASTQVMTADENHDPYAMSTDFKGSTIIIDELEDHRNSQGLKEALTRFRNIRRAGRHPRYIVYSKLIAAAAKEGRPNLTHDVLGMARKDIPYLAGYPIVQHGWVSILDAMVGACLTAGKRVLAEQFHQELLELGSAPSANTYGLYITTLKESTRTFDEASEAVNIFHRAVSEGVQPSSFLYNALIGKLGKARRIDDCLRYFQEMRTAGIRPTSVTYGTVVNALCRVSDERFAEELFDEMESMPNYKPRPAPYNSLMQYFLTTKRDSKKVLTYYQRMQSKRIEPTMHTYKLLIDTYATLEPVDLAAAEGILDTIRAKGMVPEAVHYASLIHARGCVLHDMVGAREMFDKALSSKEIQPQPCLYQALFESMVANHCVADTEEVLDSMSSHGVKMTPYIANTLIHGWATEKQIAKSKAIYESVGLEKREPSTYESMTRAFLTAEDRKGAMTTVQEMLSRGYPSAVSGKILDLVGHGVTRATGSTWSKHLVA